MFGSAAINLLWLNPVSSRVRMFSVCFASCLWKRGLEGGGVGFTTYSSDQLTFHAKLTSSLEDYINSLWG